MQKEVQKYPDVFHIEKYELDDKQKYAVVSDEVSGLVVAGAGCGKTSMLISKIAYLLKKDILPDDILVLSYTKKTVKDLKDRLEAFTQITPTTIHAFCKNTILEETEKNRVDKNLLGEVIRRIRRKKPNVVNRFYRLILEYLGLYNDTEDEFDKLATSFNSKKTIVQYENSKNYTTLNAIIRNFEKKNETLKGNKVKSLAEAQISNFLFLNDIKYEYEKEYTLKYCGETTDKHKSYCPDFCLDTNVGNIWIEHFGITKNENKDISARWCKDEKKYIQQMYEKIQTHKHNHTILIQTNQTLLKKGKLLTHLESELHKYGVIFKPLSEEQVEQYVLQLIKGQKYKAFEEFLERFINLFKSQEHFQTLEELEKYLYKEYKYQSIRTQKFFNIVKPIYEEYKKELKKRNLLDFSDMIVGAIEKLRNGEYVPKYKYIIVDEFQDITRCTYELIHLLQEKSGAKLFCVGDDWQSIYGFAGSDVSLFKSFEELFPLANANLKLTKTHRNSQELLDITKSFIEKNPLQIQKNLESSIHTHYPIKVAHFYKNKIDKDGVKGCPNASDALEIIIKDIYQQDNNNPNITILGRYNDDIDAILGQSDLFVKGENIDGNPIIFYKNKKINFTTIHKAKGLEFDNVILFLQEGDKLFSFPSGFTDDYLLEPLLYKTDNFINAEERRIFYVAMTRCKKQCYIINSEQNPSSFYQEIKKDCYSLNYTLEEYCKKIGKDICPACGCGIYEERTSNLDHKHKFWACDNPNCDAQTNEKAIKKCPDCGGLLFARTNKNNNDKFLGCQNYPQCKHTEGLSSNIEEKK